MYLTSQSGGSKPLHEAYAIALKEFYKYRAEQEERELVAQELAATALKQKLEEARLIDPEATIETKKTLTEQFQEWEAKEIKDGSAYLAELMEA